MGGSVRSRRGSMPATIAGHPHAAAALLLGLLVLASLWPALVGGEVFAPIADLYGLAPFQPYAPADVQHYLNGLLLDIPTVQYPWRFLVRELLREGVVPAWNRYAISGIPLYSNPQTGLFSLFNLPLWILPLSYGLGVAAAAKLLAGGFGTYLLARQLRLGFLPGLLAGVAFAFCSINVVWLSHDTLPGVAVMLPWAIWLVERIFERGRAAGAPALALVVAIGLGGGHPGMQVHLVAVTAAYALARAAWAAGTRRERLRALGLVAAGLGAGVLLMAFMLLPEARSAHGTVGVLARRSNSLPGQHIPLTALQTVALPDRWGRPSGYENVAAVAHGRFGFPNYNERTFYAGVVALLLAGIALVSPGQWRRKAPFALLGALGLGVALRAPGLWWLATHLPVLSSVEAERLHFAFEFAVAVLAAFGLQALLDRPRGERRRFAVLLVALLGGALAVVTAHVGGADVAATLRHFARGTSSADAGVLALTSIAWFLLFALGVTATVLVARARPRLRLAAGAAVVLLAVADALHFAHGYVPMGPASKVIPPTTPAIAYLERHRDEGRVVGLGNALPNDWDLLYGLEDVRGYDTPQPTRRMLALWQLANPQQIAWQPLMVERFDDPARKVLSMLGARYVVAAPGTPRAAWGGGRLRAVYVGPDATIVENRGAAPRALVPVRTLLTAGERATAQRIVEARFDPRTTALVEAGQRGAGALGRQHGSVRGSVAIVRREDASVTLRARLDRSGLVVLNEALMDGWSVRVDGRPAPALHVDDVMRGVVVPAGAHTVVWSYAVPGLRLGALVSLLTLAGLAASAVALRVRERRRALRRR